MEDNENKPKPQNRSEALIEYRARLAERGLRLIRFDGYTLHLDYSPENDSEFKSGAVIPASDLNEYAIDLVNEYLPIDLFPGLGNVSVNL